MRLIAVAVLAATPVAAMADGFCGVADQAEILSRLSGDWVRAGSTSIEGADTSFVREARVFATNISADGLFQSGFVDSLMGEALPLEAVEPKTYDVDRVDDMLETTGRADLADLLSDTRCGPEALPQLQLTLPEEEGGITVFGTITVIPYFDDRLLEISELTMKSGETVLFLTETVLLQPAQ